MRKVDFFIMVLAFQIPIFSTSYVNAKSTEGELQTYGIMSAVGATILGIAGVSAFIKASDLHDAAFAESSSSVSYDYVWKNEDNGRYYSAKGKSLQNAGDSKNNEGAWLLVGGIAGTALSIYFFNQKKQLYGSLIQIQKSTVAFRIPRILVYNEMLRLEILTVGGIL